MCPLGQEHSPDKNLLVDPTPFIFGLHPRNVSSEQRVAPDHTIYPLSLFWENCSSSCLPMSVCPAGGFGKHGQAPLLSAASLYSSEGFLQVGFHPRQSKAGLLGLGCSVLSIKSAQRESERKIRTNLLDVCYLLLKHSSQSLEAGERRLTCWQHISPYILMLKTPLQDLKNLLLSYH